MTESPPELMWANFFEFSYNNYSEKTPHWFNYHNNQHLSYSPTLRWDQALWEDLTRQMAAAGCNTILLHLGDAIRYESHPEIAVDGAWSPLELKGEIQRLKTLGIDLYPMLNFSTAHDLWLGDYHRMVSTAKYYEVCADLIAEVVEIFDRPKYFSLGYDEETAQHQRWYDYSVVRHRDLWWDDFIWFNDQVEQYGCRNWIWSDKIWEHNDEFLTRMPRTVLQSNWYYPDNFDLDVDLAAAIERGIDLREPEPGLEREQTTPLRAFLELERGEFDQVPAGSIDVAASNFVGNVRFARQHIPRQRTFGFMQTYWRPVIEEFREFHESGVRAFAEGVAAWNE